MVGLMMVAGGALQGVGEGLVEEAKARREAAIEALRNKNIMAREDADRSFRREEGEATRSFQAEQNQLTRDFQAETGGDLVTTEDGASGVRVGSTVRPLQDEQGNPVKAVTPDKDASPADVKAAEWLIKQGVAKDAADAWGKVRSAREGQTTPADIEKMVEDAVKTEFEGGFAKPDREELEASRERNRARIMKNLGLTEESDGAAFKRPAGATDEQIIEQAKAALVKGAPEAAVRSRLRQMGIDPVEAGL